MRTHVSQLVGFILVLGLALGAHAQDEGDLALLAGKAGVPPNVMLIFDTSLSMQSVLWHDDFDPKVFYDRTPLGLPTKSTECNIGSVSSVPGSDGQCPGSGDVSDACPDNEFDYDRSDQSDLEIRCPAEFANECDGWPASLCRVSYSYVYLALPDFDADPTQDTLWAENYSHWWVGQILANGGKPISIPQQTRLMGAKAALTTLVNDTNPDDGTGGYEENVRFGLAKLDYDDGSYVIVPIAPGNKATLLNTIATIPLEGWTPLSEALVDVGRYFVGAHDTLGSYPQYNRNTTDGGPFGTIPSSPIDPAVYCRDNFVILMTDGEPTQDLNDHYGAAFTNTFGGGDYDADGNDVLVQTNSCFSKRPSCPSDYLDDVALYLARNDLIDDGVISGKQSIVTYTIGFNVDTPLLEDAAKNGGGKYITTRNSDVLASRLKEIVQDIIERATTFTSASVPASRSAFGDGFYTAYFLPSALEPLWAGHLEAYRITSDNQIVGKDNQPALDPVTGKFVDPRIPIWDAAYKLAGTNGEPAHPARSLYTTRLGLRTPFSTWGMSAADLNILASDLTLYPNDPNVPFPNTEVLADAIVNYLHGRDAFDEDRDGDAIETREVVLGDIFHSNPMVVGPPPPFHLQEDGFGPVTDSNSFFSRFALRDRKLYVGANDGMLHAFNSGTIVFGDNPATPSYTEIAYYDFNELPQNTGGQEAFGYVPSFLLTKLKEIPLQTMNNRKFFVDGSPAVADAWLPSTSGDVSKEADEWSSVLVTGMRRGGDGYLALDITDPSGASAAHAPYPKLLWEFADPAEPLGETWSKPVIARVRVEGGPGGDFCNTGVSPPPNCVEQWVAIFAGGYRPTGDGALATFAGPSDGGWTADSKAIFMVSLDSGQVLAKVQYDAADPVRKSMIYSMPSNPAVLDIDFDGFVDLIYVGDTGGQLWKWDISEIGSFGGSGLVTTWDDDVGVFFRAPIAANGHPRSLFFPPSAALIEGRLTLSFGTGERTDLEYTTDAVIDDRNRFYVIHDPAPTGADSIPSSAYTESDLTKLNGMLEDPDTTDLGFYLVADAHEKFVTNSIAFAGFLITASYFPDTSGGADPCGSAGGKAFLYVFDLETGGGFFDSDPTAPTDETRRLALGSGLPTDPRVTTSASGGEIVIQTSGGTVGKQKAPGEVGDPVQIVFWRQQL